MPQKYLLVLLCAFLLQIGACSDIVSRAFSVAVSESFHRTLSHTRLFYTLRVGPATIRGLRPVYVSWFQIRGWSKTLTHLQTDRQVDPHLTDIICERPLTSGSRNQFVSNTFSLFPTTNQIAERERNFFNLGTIRQTFSSDDKYLFRTAHHKVNGFWMATWESPNLSW